MRPAPFTARWQAGPVVAGAFEARFRLDDQAPFAGHYPGAPILPGSFLIEALLQAVSTALGNDHRLEEIVACRFHSPLLPGDEVVAHFALKEAGSGATLVEVTANGRGPAAQLSMLVGPLVAPAPHSSQEAIDTAPPLEQAPADGRALDPAFIHRALPHRHPALLVDSANVLEHPGGASTLLARKAVTLGERCYAGADGLSTWSYPPSLIIESFCQACGLLRGSATPAGERRDDTKVPVVAKLAGLRFIGDVVPGDLLEHHVRMVASTPDGAVFSGQTVVARRTVMQVGRVVAAVAALLRR